MKYKVGDKVRIKSIEWYNKNKEADNCVSLIGINNSRYDFLEPMSEFCGQEVRIRKVNNGYYDILEDGYEHFWTEEMFEGKVEEQLENDNKYRLDKSDDDKLATEVTCNDFKLVAPNNYLIGKVTPVDDGMLVEFVKKHQKYPQYPKTYEECCQYLGWDELTRLINARNAYWKIAGEEMGLDKPWEPDYQNKEGKTFFFLFNNGEFIEKGISKHPTNTILIFPSEEMCDTFYENFKDLIDKYKKLL